VAAEAPFAPVPYGHRLAEQPVPEDAAALWFFA